MAYFVEDPRMARLAAELGRGLTSEAVTLLPCELMGGAAAAAVAAAEETAATVASGGDW